MSIDKVLTYDTELTDDIGYTVHPINLALGESLGHTVKVNVYRNGTKITDSASCKAKFLRADGSTVEINGSFSGGVAAVTLPSSCYTVEGAAKLSVSLVSGSTISTVFIMICNVNRYSTTSIVDSNQVVPNIEKLLENIDKLEHLIGEAEGLSLNKVGYAEIDVNTLYLYSDETKQKIVSSVILPSGGSGGSGGTGLTTEQLNALTQNTNARHTHSNKDVLDGITASRIAKWDSAGSGSGGGTLSVRLDEWNNIVLEGNEIHGDEEPSGGSGSQVTVDAALSSTSTNPVQNKVVYTELSKKYVKPSTGIPIADLSADLQNKINNAGSGASSGSSGTTVAAENGAYATLEMFGGVSGDSSATARAANTKAVTDAILAGYNIRCDSRNSSVNALKTYFFSGWSDVRAIQYRSIDIDLNGCRFCDFHIIANIVADSEMTESYCSWGWNNGNKFTLKIHDGLIGATSAGSTMASLPNDPIAVTGLIPNFYNLQLLGSAHLLAMPPVYCDQLYMDNIKVNCNNASQWTYWADTYECISVIRGKDASGNYIYKNNGVDSKGVNGDQFTFSRLNDCRNFFTIWNNLGTSVRNCISSSFAINQSMVEMTLCHSESELLYSIVGGTQTTVIFNQCYFNQDQIDIFRTVSANTQKMMTFNDCVVRVGNIGGNHNVALEPEAFGFMLNASGTLKLHTMGRTIVGGRAINPPRVFCTASTISTAENASAGGIKTADGTNQKLGAYHYIVGLHSTNKVNVAHTKIEADVTYSSQFSLYRLALSNYCGQRIIMYKSDSSGNKYRCIIDSYNINGNLYLDDCGAFVSVWTYDVTFPTSTGRVSDGYAWEKVSSIPTITTNANLRQSGDLIYDTSGKIYTAELTAIN